MHQSGNFNQANLECASQILSIHLTHQKTKLPHYLNAYTTIKDAYHSILHAHFGNMATWLCFYSLLGSRNWSLRIQYRKSCSAGLRERMRSDMTAVSQWNNPYSRTNQLKLLCRHSQTSSVCKTCVLKKSAVLKWETTDDCKIFKLNDLCSIWPPQGCVLSPLLCSL